MTEPIFDIIIPVFGPDETFARALSMLARQTAKPRKLILMETVEPGKEPMIPQMPGIRPDLPRKQDAETPSDTELQQDDAPQQGTSQKLPVSVTRLVYCPGQADGEAPAKGDAAAEIDDSAAEDAPAPLLHIWHTVVPRRKFDHGATRRQAVTLSDAPVFLMMTQDAVPADENLCARLLTGLSKSGTFLCYARQTAGEKARDIERVTREFNYPRQSREKTAADLSTLGIKAFFASNVCCAYDRSTYDRLGGFPEHAIFNEDMIFARKVLDAGGRIRYEAEAVVQHSHDYTALQQFRRNFDLGMSQADHPETFGGIRSEGEGLRLVFTVMKHIHPLHIPRLFVQSGAKYLGYRMGKAYRKLPAWIVKKCTSNRPALERMQERT